MPYDNTCKYLAEQYPAAFAQWLLKTDTSNVQVLKAELGLEPIRADSLTFLQAANQILHVEFQTLFRSEPPLPFRMLDYSVRLKRKYRCPVEQVVIFLQQTANAVVFTEVYQDQTTVHRYRAIRLWEQEPEAFLTNPALLPLATLTKSNSPQRLLERVAVEVAKIEEINRQQNISACVQVLAGLRFNKDLIGQLFRRELMRESVIYQDILREGRQEGRQQGKQEEALLIIRRILTRKLGSLPSEIEAWLRRLSVSQLEALSEVMLDFTSTTELSAWLDEQSGRSPS